MQNIKYYLVYIRLFGYIHIFSYSTSEKSEHDCQIASCFISHIPTEGIVSQQNQFILQSESPGVEREACPCLTDHPHKKVPEITRNISKVNSRCKHQ